MTTSLISFVDFSVQFRYRDAIYPNFRNPGSISSRQTTASLIDTETNIGSKSNFPPNSTFYYDNYTHEISLPFSLHVSLILSQYPYRQHHVGKAKFKPPHFAAKILILPNFGGCKSPKFGQFGGDSIILEH